MDTATVLTLQLARALGIFIIATGLAGLASPGRWKLIMDDYQRSPALTHFTAAVVLGLGLTLVAFHNLWVDPLAILVSLVAWIVLAEGLILLIMPAPALKLGAASVGSPAAVRVWAIIAIILGAVLLVASLTGRAVVSV